MTLVNNRNQNKNMTNYKKNNRNQFKIMKSVRTQ